jgi:hypothetical protein
MASKELEAKLKQIIYKSLKDVRPNLRVTIGDSYAFGAFVYVPLEDPVWSDLYIDIKLTCYSPDGSEGTLFDPGVGKALGISSHLMKELE